MDIDYLFQNTELTQAQIGMQLGLTHKQVSSYVTKRYSKEYRSSRKRACYRDSKLGTRNPQFGKPSHNAKEIVSDNKGYWMTLKPSWYTGRKGSRHVFVHSVVVCQGLGITEVPKKWVVHHCDFNPSNNDFDNLVMLTMGDHNRLHRHLEGVTTISKESTLKWVETHGTPFRRGDIVSSAWEHAAAKAEQEVTTPVEDK